ncbi:hypothetical protein HOY80DRAFT_1031980 [Tuber brumale]|nr:hypothetical protein HOY80DRAFT_1031980 [Tuber brumale]
MVLPLGTPAQWTVDIPPAPVLTNPALTNKRCRVPELASTGVLAAKEDPYNKGVNMTPTNKRHRVQETAVWQTAVSGILATEEEPDNGDHLSALIIQRHHVWKIAAKGVLVAENEPDDRNLYLVPTMNIRGAQETAAKSVLDAEKDPDDGDHYMASTIQRHHIHEHARLGVPCLGSTLYL